MTRWTLALPFVSSCTPETLAAPWLSRNEVEEVICLHAPDAPPASSYPNDMYWSPPCQMSTNGKISELLVRVSWMKV